MSTDSTLKMAQKALEEGRRSEAAKLLSPILQSEPANKQALAMMAEATDSPQEAAELRQRLAQLNPPPAPPQPQQQWQQPPPGYGPYGYAPHPAAGQLAHAEMELRRREQQQRKIQGNRTAGAIAFFLGLVGFFFIPWLGAVAALIGLLTYFTAAANSRKVESEMRYFQDQIVRIRSGY